MPRSGSSSPWRSNRDVLETLKLGYSIFAAGLILPVLAALLAPGRVPTAGAIGGMIAGGGLAAIGRFWPAAVGGADPVLAGTGINLAILAVAAIAGAARRPVPS